MPSWYQWNSGTLDKKKSLSHLTGKANGIGVVRGLQSRHHFHWAVQELEGPSQRLSPAMLAGDSQNAAQGPALTCPSSVRVPARGCDTWNGSYWGYYSFGVALKKWPPRSSRNWCCLCPWEEEEEEEEGSSAAVSQLCWKSLPLSVVSITALCQTFCEEDWFVPFVQTTGWTSYILLSVQALWCKSGISWC